MKIIDKKRLLSPYVLAAVFSMPLILFISFCIQSNLFDLMFVDKFSDIPIAEVDAAKKLLIGQVLDWNYYHIHSNSFTPLFYPLFATLPVLYFSYENGGYLQYVFTRAKQYKSTVYSRCLMYSLLSGFTMLIGYTLFIMMGFVLGLSTPEYDTGMFVKIFPNLMIDNPVVGGILHALSVYFVFGFVFGLFASTVSINTNKSYLTLLIPHAYYLVIGNILSTFYNITKIHTIHQFSPWYPVTITGEVNTWWYAAYFYAIPILIISIGLIVWRVHRETKIDF